MKNNTPKTESRTDWSRLREMPDRDIDCSEIAEQGPDFFRNATVRLPLPKKSVSIRLDRDVLEWFQAQGRGYQTRMNAVLRTYMQAHSR